MNITQAVAVGLVGICVAMGAKAQKGVGADEAAIRAVEQRQNAGYDEHDAAKVVSCFAEDMIWQNPFGVRIKSKEKLQKFLTNLFQRPGYLAAKDTSAPHITDIHMLSPTTAAVWSEEKSEGQKDDRTGQLMKPRYTHYLEVFVKKDGKWLVADSMIMDEYLRE
jgi:uncharacterized protein (TIGR02246 family)